MSFSAAGFYNFTREVMGPIMPEYRPARNHNLKALSFTIFRGFSELFPTGECTFPREITALIGSYADDSDAIEITTLSFRNGAEVLGNTQFQGLAEMILLLQQGTKVAGGIPFRFNIDHPVEVTCCITPQDKAIHHRFTIINGVAHEVLIRLQGRAVSGEYVVTVQPKSSKKITRFVCYEDSEFLAIVDVGWGRSYCIVEKDHGKQHLDFRRIVEVDEQLMVKEGMCDCSRTIGRDVAANSATTAAAGSATTAVTEQPQQRTFSDCNVS